MTENDIKVKLSVPVPNSVQKEKVKRIEISTKSSFLDGPQQSNQYHIDHIPREIHSMFPNLQKLFIKSQIEEILPEDFRTAEGQSDYIEINLSRNKLTIIKRNTFSLVPLLEKLSLSVNTIETIESGAFSGLSKLKALDIAGNRLKALKDDTFDGLIALKGIELSHNGMETIGNSLYSLDFITMIGLSYNKISDIDFEKFAKLSKLKKLDLYQAAANLTSNVNELASEESLQSSLEVLDVAFNNLTIEAALKLARVFPTLTKINFSGSKFQNEPAVLKQFQDVNDSLLVKFKSLSMIDWLEERFR